MPAGRDLRYGTGTRQRLDLHLPPPSAPRPCPAVVFFHPGALHFGDKGEPHNRALAAALAAGGAAVAVPNYRLGAEGRFPRFLEDAAAATAWVARQAGRLGVDPEALFLAGHSAGGYIAAMLALDRRWLDAAGLAPGAVAGAIGLAGMYEFDAADLLLRPVFGEPEDPAAQQPATHARPDAPPLLLLAGALDLVGGQFQALAMARRVREAGGRAHARIYPWIGHMGLLAPPLSGQAPVVEDMLRFMVAVRGAGAGPGHWSPRPAASGHL